MKIETKIKKLVQNYQWDSCRENEEAKDIVKKILKVLPLPKKRVPTAEEWKDFIYEVDCCLEAGAKFDYKRLYNSLRDKRI